MTMNNKFDNLTAELLKKAKGAATKESLIEIAKEAGFELTGQEAQICFDKLAKRGQLADEELENVSGGGCGATPEYNVGDVVTHDMGCFGYAPHLRRQNNMCCEHKVTIIEKLNACEYIVRCKYGHEYKLDEKDLGIY